MLTREQAVDQSVRHKQRLAFCAALLFMLGGLTGIPLALAQTGKLDADARTLLSAHLNALAGAFWLLGLGWSLSHCRIGERLTAVLCGLVIVASFSNWALTGVKAVLGVHGLEFTGDVANDLVAGGLNALVVLPTLAAAALWAFALLPGRGRAR
jgi:hydroxylaminobenzene mutase